ncbi:hypothetical protein LB553_04585 [Mesorhizobium sp. CA8]|nr:hypothetical protein [Mesorhizobium sp. CA8]MBZ9760153.1 hypothetical protein [Mesorhizobium sp. CA8]
MTFADKCKLLGKRRGRNTALAAGDNKLRAALRWSNAGRSAQLLGSATQP